MRKLLTIVIGTVIVALASSSAAFAQEKTAKACRDEWRGAKAACQAAHVTEKAYVAGCRTGQMTITACGTAPSASPSASPAAPSGSAGQFSTEAEAKSRCAGDTVVWVNLKSHVYHFAGHRNYGHTKSGAFMCERAATAAGNRAAKNEKRPSA